MKAQTTETPRTEMPRRNPGQVSVIIVNYGTSDLVIQGIDSVLARVLADRLHGMHVVDNAAGGNDAADLAQAHAEKAWGPAVALHPETENHGFGRGNNVALRALAANPEPPEYVFLLNPDARLTTDTVSRLADFLDAHPAAAVAGCGIARPDGSRVPAAFRFPSVKSEFVTGAQFGPVSRLLSDAHVALPSDLPTREVDWVSGAALMIRFDVLRKLGFFDPDFFLYFEETELMHRIRAAGYEIWHVEETAVEHDAGAATGMQGGRHRSKAQPGYWYDSWRLYFVKTRGPWYARGAALARLAGWGLNIVLRGLQGRRGDGPAHFLRDFGARVLRPLFLGDPYEARPDGRTVAPRKAEAAR